MALPYDQQQVFDRLNNLLMLSRPEVLRLNDIYEGMARLRQLGLAIPPELRRFTVVLNWPRVKVDAVEQRLDVTGFRIDGQADLGLWDVWQYNNMDERQSLAHIDSLALTRAYVCVGTNDQDPDYPLVTVESPLQMIASRDPRTHQITAALRTYSSNEVINNQAIDRATLYLPDVTRWLKLDSMLGWVDEFEPDQHNLGVVPVVALVNRARATLRRNVLVEGVSEMADVIPVADSASRALTNTQLLQETLVAPARGVLGMSKGDFVGADGQPLDAWKTYFGAVWASENASAKTFQFDAADTTNMDTVLNMYARQASSVGGLPVEYFGLNTQNPPSADGQRAGETRLIRLAERRQTSFGHAWEQVMRLVLLFRDGAVSDSARRMETIWRDAGTPTISQVTDAVQKQYASGLLDWESAQEQLGRSPQQIAVMKERRQAELASALTFGVQQANQQVASE